MTNATDITRIEDKVRKLLAMGSDQRGNEQERETAMRQAYALMTKHNLTVSQVGGTQGEEKREEQRVRLSVYPWARGIAHSLAQLFFCAYYFQRGHAGKLATHSFVGKVSNAVTASSMAEYVVSNVFKELRARYGSETAPEARSFATGVETAIRARCSAMRAHAEEESRREARAAEQLALQTGTPSTGTALVLASVYATERKANDAWIAEHVGTLKAAADRTKGVGGSAYAEGKAHGARINLSRQVGTAAAPKAIK